jgi:hypothetical protein
MNHRIGFCCNLLSIFVAKMAPAVGFEPTTNRLTADRSTTELRWIFVCRSIERREFCAAHLLRQV